MIRQVNRCGKPQKHCKMHMRGLSHWSWFLVSADTSCHQEGLKGSVHQVNVRNSRARFNACWKCGGLGHFQKDCKATLSFQSGDKDNLALSDTNTTISQMSHTLTTFMPITNPNFKAIQKEMVSSVIGKMFCPIPQSILKNISQPSMSGASPTATPVMTAETGTSSPQTMSQLAPSMISLGITSLPVNLDRGPSQPRHQTAVSRCQVSD